MRGNAAGAERRRARKIAVWRARKIAQQTQSTQERATRVIRPQGRPRETKREQERPRESKREQEREREGGET